VYYMGKISEPVCQITVGLNKVGIILLGGMNPIATAVEAGFEVENAAESGMLDFKQLISIWEL
ncbi:MAG: NrpR regulatory domain-containing protein, partial [Chloroflexota bacterium]